MAFVLAIPEVCELLVAAFTEYTAAAAAETVAVEEAAVAETAALEAAGNAVDSAAVDSGIEDGVFEAEELRRVADAKHAVRADLRVNTEGKWSSLRDKVDRHGYGPCGNQACHDTLAEYGYQQYGHG